jgi:hypothetical protein
MKGEWRMKTRISKLLIGLMLGLSARSGMLTARLFPLFVLFFVGELAAELSNSSRNM